MSGTFPPNGLEIPGSFTLAEWQLINQAVNTAALPLQLSYPIAVKLQQLLLPYMPPQRANGAAQTMQAEDRQ